MDKNRFAMLINRKLAARQQEAQPMTRNEIARRLQQALVEYEGMRARATSGAMALEMAAHDFATRIGGIVTDIDADVERERSNEAERESMTPIAPYWPDYPDEYPEWNPIPNSPLNSLDGE